MYKEDDSKFPHGNTTDADAEKISGDHPYFHPWSQHSKTDYGPKNAYGIEDYNSWYHFNSSGEQNSQPTSLWKHTGTYGAENYPNEEASGKLWNSKKMKGQSMEY